MIAPRTSMASTESALSVSGFSPRSPAEPAAGSLETLVAAVKPAILPSFSHGNILKPTSGVDLASNGCARDITKHPLADPLALSLSLDNLSKQQDSDIRHPAPVFTCQNFPLCTHGAPVSPLTNRKRLVAASAEASRPDKRPRHTQEEEQSTLDLGPARHGQQTSLLNTFSIWPQHGNKQLLHAMPVLPHALTTPCPGERASMALVPACLALSSCPCAGVAPCVPEVYYNRALQVVQAQAEKLRVCESLTWQLVEELCMARAQLRTALQQTLACTPSAGSEAKGEGQNRHIHGRRTQQRQAEESQGSASQKRGQEDQEISSAESAAESLDTDDLAIMTLSYEDQLCQLCTENMAVTVALPCRHLVLCRGCAPDCLECPRCTTILQGVLHLAL